MLYLGCDQHRKQITISLRDDAGHVIQRRQVSTRPDKINAFLQAVRDAAGEDGFMAILEVCGFNDWFIALLYEFGCRELVLIHPGKPGKRKTDRRDADQLGQLLWINRERLLNGHKPHGLRRVVIPTDDDQQNRQLTGMRQRLARQRTRTINAVRGLLRKHNLMWEQPTKGIDTKTARRWLRHIPLPEIDRFEMDQLLVRWDQCDEQIEDVQHKIGERVAGNRAAELLLTIPGVAHYGALGLAARIGNIDRFPHPRSLANYFGLTPGCRNSGERSDRLGSITKEGSQFARFLLGQVVLHVLKKDPEMRNWFQKIKRRRGSKIARVAVMRRLCTIMWHMLKHEEPYVAGGPSRLKTSRSEAALAKGD